MLTPQENEMLTRTGRDTPMGELLRRFWAPVLLANEVRMPDCPATGLKVMGQELAAFRDATGRVALLDARCPHRGANLALGYNEGGRLQCPVCLWLFDADGNCLEIPMEPEETGLRKSIYVSSYPTVERAGVVWVYLGPASETPEMPEFEWTQVPEDHRYISKFLVECNYAQAVEAGIDASRVSFLSGAGDSDASASSPAETAPWDIYGANQPTQRVLAKPSDYGILIGVRTDAGDDANAWRFTQWLFPFYTTTLTEAAGLRGGIAWVPADDENTMALAVTYSSTRPLSAAELEECRNGSGLHPELDSATYRRKSNRSNGYRPDDTAPQSNPLASIRGVLERALVCQESMGTIVDRSQEELGPNDVAILATRDRLLKAAIDLLEGTEPAAAHNGEAYGVRTHTALLSREVAFDEDQAVRAALRKSD